MTHNTEPTEVDTATKQDVDAKKVHDETGNKFAPGNNANPTGAGGFGDNPENRSSGHWDKEESISYWYNKLLRMTDEEYDAWKPANRAQRIAHQRIVVASGGDELALKTTKEITDRTEGRPKQDIDMNVSGDDVVPLIKGFVIPTLPEHFIEQDIINQAGEQHLK